MPRRLRVMLLPAAVWLLALAALASPALAANDNGEGLAGEVDDRIVTFFSLGVVAFFALFVVVMSVIGAKLEKRKREKKAGRLQQRIGW